MEYYTATKIFMKSMKTFEKYFVRKEEKKYFLTVLIKKKLYRHRTLISLRIFHSNKLYP